MPKFYAVTSKGLEDVLESELNALQFKDAKKSGSGVDFEGSWKDCYRANLCLRTAHRILYPVLDFSAYQPDELYNNIKKHDFTKYILPHQTLMVESRTKESQLRDQRLVALKVKDAIVDQFREKFDVRPSVNKETPELKIHVKVYKNRVSVALDTSGESLSNRGYRKEAGDAPLRESLAAGLLMMTGWDCQRPLVDPMCGSGTLLIEAALMALNVAPGTLKSRFAFQKWLTFQEDKWVEVLEQVLSEEKESLEVPLFGFDRSGQVIRMAKANAKRAGVEDLINFQKASVDLLESPSDQVPMIVTNPPYGERLDDLETAKDVYRDMSFGFKKNFAGSIAWILSGNPELTRELKMKSAQKYRVYNGPIECRWVKYQINK